MSVDVNAAVIETKKDFKDTPRGQHAYWTAEIDAQKKTLGNWHKQGDKIVSRYLDSKAAGQSRSAGPDIFKLNLFHSNVKTQYSMLYGNLPKIDVSRRYSDANDDVARVAAETMERLLNCDVAENGEEYDSVFRSTLLDRLLPGLGVARVRYEFDTEMVKDELGQDVEQVTNERAPIDYIYWQDFLWSWCRNYKEMRWQAFRSYLTKDEVIERFGEKIAEGLTYKQQNSKESEGQQGEDNLESAWMKAEIWEIWDKSNRKVIWYHKDFSQILETKDDPLQLKNFYPAAPPFMANPTSTLYIPTPDFQLCQDLYNSIDQLQTRIAIITDAVKVVGVYDASQEGIQRMFQEGVDNDLIPVENWAIFGEKGGVSGTVDWLPIGDIVNALDKLTQKRDEEIALLQQISGMSDVMRGGLDNQYEGVGQSQMKAKFGSVRMQAMQDQFAQFCSDILQIKAEIIARHFDPKTIANLSNMQHSFDKDLLIPAIQLIKNPQQAKLRIAIRPESVAMVDYASLREERTGFLTAISTYMQSAATLMADDPTAKPFLLQMLQWAVSGFKGAQEIEGVMDKAIESTMEQAKNQQDKPDPAQVQAQMDAQKEQAKLQGEMQKIQAKAMADMQVRENDKQADIETAAAQHQMDLQRIEAEGLAAIREIQVKAEADIQTELVQSQANIQQSLAGSQAEVEKAAQTADIEIAKKVHEADIEMGKDTAKAQIDIGKEVSKAELDVAKEAAKPSKGPNAED